MNFEPIGVVKSIVTKEMDEKWGQVLSDIQISKHLTPGLKGLEHFSHIMVVFYMHKALFNANSDLVRRPQGRVDMPEIGIFSQRAKHRPTPIGVTTVQLIKVNENILTVKGLDAIDGTPVLDIKPHFPAFDIAREVRIPQWVEMLMKGYF